MENKIEIWEGKTNKKISDYVSNIFGSPGNIGYALKSKILYSGDKIKICKPVLNSYALEKGLVNEQVYSAFMLSYAINPFHWVNSMIMPQESMKALEEEFSIKDIKSFLGLFASNVFNIHGIPGKVYDKTDGNKDWNKKYEEFLATRVYPENTDLNSFKNKLEEYSNLLGTSGLERLLFAYRKLGIKNKEFEVVKRLKESYSKETLGCVPNLRYSWRFESFD